MKLWKKELIIQEEYWPDCSNKYVNGDPKEMIKHCQDDISGEIWKFIPCHCKIQKLDQGLANHKKW